MKTTWLLCLSALSLIAAAGPAAQSKASLVTVTSKLERIEDAAVEDEGSPAISDAERDAREDELLELEDEVAYLRVKTRRGLPISAEEYRVLEQRLDRFMARIGLAFDRAVRGEIPVGVDLDARLLGRLSSGDAEVEGGVEATTLVDLRHDDVVLIPAGAVVRGRVAAVDHAGVRAHGGALTLQFDQLYMPSGIFEVGLVVVGALERSGPDGASGRDSGRAGQALHPGVVTGGVVPGLTHTPWSALAGTAGTFRSTKGHDVELTPGTILRLRFDAPLTLQ